MEPALFCIDAYHVDTQHLACEGVVHDSWNDLLPIRRDLTIVGLPIVPVGDPDDNSCTRCHGDGCLEVLLVDGVPDLMQLNSIRVREPLGNQSGVEYTVLAVGAFADHKIIIFDLARINVIGLLAAVILTNP